MRLHNGRDNIKYDRTIYCRAELKPVKRSHLFPGFGHRLKPVSPSLPTRIARRQKGFRQQRIALHGVPPCLPLRLKPTVKGLGRLFAVKRPEWTSCQDSLVRRVAFVEVGEIPRAGDNLRVGFAGAGSGFEQDERSDIHRAISKPDALLVHWIRSNPDAVLQASEAPASEVIAKPVPVGGANFRNIEERQAPTSVPATVPARLRIASAQGLEPARLGQTVKAVAGFAWLAFDPLLFFQPLQLAKKAVAVSPALE